MKKLLLFLIVTSLSPMLHAGAPTFESQLFKNGTLIYSDDFDGELDRKRWQPRTKSWEVKHGVLVGKPDYSNKEEAMKALKRDHHLGLSPVIRLDHLPKKFVLHLRVKFEGKAFATGRPKFDIGHHINTVTFNAKGYGVKLHDGKQFSGRAPNVRLNEWIDVVLEFQEGEMRIEVNGQGQTIRHEQVSLKGRSELTFKTFADAPNRIFFDSVRLWKID
ncbi:MAG: hypothetical protein ACPGVU_10070 [Limisphaerales bacterium]